jgi:hypothetical protein
MRTRPRLPSWRTIWNVSDGPGVVAVDTPELPARHLEVERRLVDPPQLNTIKD